MVSFWVFIGIIAALLIAGLLLLIFLRKNIFNKHDVLKYVFVIITPLTLACLICVGFVITDFQDDRWQYDDKIDTFYGYYEGEDGHYKGVKLFEWAAYNWNTYMNRHTPLGMRHYFAVREPDKFEEYLKTVEHYSGETVDENGIKTIKFSYLGAEWSLVRNSKNSKGYEWNNSYTKGIKVGFRTEDDNQLLLEYYVNSKYEEINILTFYVNEPNNFDDYMKSVESFTAVETMDNGMELFKFTASDGKIYGILRMPLSESDIRYVWNPAPLP